MFSRFWRALQLVFVSGELFSYRGNARPSNQLYNYNAQEIVHQSYKFLRVDTDWGSRDQFLNVDTNWGSKDQFLNGQAYGFRAHIRYGMSSSLCVFKMHIVWERFMIWDTLGITSWKKKYKHFLMWYFWFVLNLYCMFFWIPMGICLVSVFLFPEIYNLFLHTVY